MQPAYLDTEIDRLTCDIGPPIGGAGRTQDPIVMAVPVHLRRERTGHLQTAISQVHGVACIASPRPRAVGAPTVRP